MGEGMGGWVGGWGVLSSMRIHGKMKRMETNENGFLILHQFYKQNHHFVMKWGCTIVDVTLVV